MPVLRVDDARATFDHLCVGPGCGAVRRGLRLDPQAGDVSVWRDASSAVTALVVRACPLCHSQESLNPDIPPWEAQEIDPATGAPVQQPASLVGATFADTGAVVTEHHHGHLPTPDHVAPIRLIRQMQRHPLIAPHAPVVELRAERYAALCRPLLGAAKHAATQTDEARLLLPGEAPDQPDQTNVPPMTLPTLPPLPPLPLTE